MSDILLERGLEAASHPVDGFNARRHACTSSWHVDVLATCVDKVSSDPPHSPRTHDDLWMCEQRPITRQGWRGNKVSGRAGKGASTAVYMDILSEGGRLEDTCGLGSQL